MPQAGIDFHRYNYMWLFKPKLQLMDARLHPVLIGLERVSAMISTSTCPYRLIDLLQ